MGGNNFLNNTLDILQKSRHISKQEFFIWRYSIIQRLQLYQSKGIFKFTTENWVFLDENVTISKDEIDPNEIHPTNVSQTRFRLSANDRQILVITFYFKKPQDIDGTILVQGTIAPSFAIEEFNALEEIVNSIDVLEQDNIHSFNAKLDSVPLCKILNTRSNNDFIATANTNNQNAAPRSTGSIDDSSSTTSLIDNKKCSSSSAPISSSMSSRSIDDDRSDSPLADSSSSETALKSAIFPASESSPSSVDSTKSRSSEHHGSNILSTTEIIRSTASTGTTEKQPASTTTTGTTETQPASTASTGTTEKQPEQEFLETEIQTDDVEFLENISERIYPLLEKELKHEISLFKLQIRNEQKAVFENMEQSYDDLELQISNLKNENQKLNSQINDYKRQTHRCDQQMQSLVKEIHDLKNTTNTQAVTIQEQQKTIIKLTAENVKQTQYADILKSNKTNTELPKRVFEKDHTLSEDTVTYNVPVQNKYQNLLRANSDNMTFDIGTPPRPIPVIGHHLSNPMQQRNNSSVSRYKTLQHDKPENEHFLSDLAALVSSGQNHTKLENQQHMSDHFKLTASALSSQNHTKLENQQHMSDHFKLTASTLSGQIHSNAEDTTNKLLENEKISSEYSHRLTRELPINVLNSHVIDKSTDYLIIGDSCINKLNPTKMNTGSYQYIQKICVSGIQTSDLLFWLESQQFNANILKVVIHVGVNNTDIISENVWSTIIYKFQSVFPNAHITMSSIIPTRTMQQTNINIAKSNTNLQKSCNLFSSVAFVDHTYAFRTSNFAPKQALYDNFNQKHPSLKGVLVLAKNIKWYGTDMEKWKGNQNQMSTQEIQSAVNKREIAMKSQQMHFNENLPNTTKADQTNQTMLIQEQPRMVQQYTMDHPHQDQNTSFQRPMFGTAQEEHCLLGQSSQTTKVKNYDSKGMIPCIPSTSTPENNSDKSEIFNTITNLLQKLLF